MPDQVRHRPTAHVLSIFGWTNDGPTYALECRAAADDYDKPCTMKVYCDHDPIRWRDGVEAFDPTCDSSPTGRHENHGDLARRPTPGCALDNLDDGEDLDVAVRDLMKAHGLGRGIYLVETYGGNGDEVIMTLLGRIMNVVGDLNRVDVLSVEPTTASRYPGYGPEVELRELIEQALSENPDTVTWDDDRAVVIVDAATAAQAVLGWIEDAYDVPPDQLSFAHLPVRPAHRERPAPAARIVAPPVVARVQGDVL